MPEIPLYSLADRSFLTKNLSSASLNSGILALKKSTSLLIPDDSVTVIITSDGDTCTRWK